ncbi:MAG: peptide chain release factor N(5)-glutamine methyltransferase [Treponema sp.]|nr:peptide chain release factor N(5)-glutamine methyltransferase [Treponema sp.]MCL2237578.1 peptide chain release factor N(5)-glutamine methyltransferase [Treponema sp.]
MMLIREAYAQGSADLKFSEIPTPALDASILLAHVLKTDRTSLVAKGMDTISAKTCEKFCSLVERRALGECIAYIIGKKEFRGLEFEVNKSVLVPRPDTETLVEAAISTLSTNLHGFSQINNKVLDLCTGSGAIAISLKNELPELEIHATDISLETLQTAQKNSEKLLGKNKIHFYLGDLFNALLTPHSSSLPSVSSASFAPPRELFSLIVSNPPYIPSAQIETLSAEVRNEPRIALDGGDDGLEIIRRIIDDAPNYLASGGRLLLEASPEQMEEVSHLLEKRGFKSIQLNKDLSGADRVIGGKI